MTKYKPWTGETEWRERQERIEARARAKYKAWVKDQLDPKCLGCSKSLGTTEHGKLVEGGKLGARCLNCQVKNR